MEVPHWDNNNKKKASERSPLLKNIIISGLIFKMITVRHSGIKQLVHFKNADIHESGAGR